MAKNIVICLDGTNNQVRAGGHNTNVVRLFDMLDLRDPNRQVGYYDPGVGTFSSPAAWTPIARTASRYAGSLFGAGMRHNLGEAYCYLMSTYEPGDHIFVFGFSRGAYTARALTGMLDVFGILRQGSENLVPYAISEYTKQESKQENLQGSKRDWSISREYVRIFGGNVGLRHKGHAPVHFVGIWDTVKAAGHLGRQLRWPFTRQLPHVQTVRHAVSIDEQRRPFVEYLVYPTSPQHLLKADQSLVEVWFAGVHSDVGGAFPKGTQLSNIPLKWMAEQAAHKGLLIRSRSYSSLSKQVGDAEATGTPHGMKKLWRLLGTRHRTIPTGAMIHASVEVRIKHDPAYGKRLPPQYTFVDRTWATRMPLPETPRRRRARPQ